MDWITNTFDPWLESRKSSNTLIIFFLLLSMIPIIGVGLATTRTILPNVIHIPALLSQPSEYMTARFTCSAGKSIDASFTGPFVTLSLSDGRHLTLPLARSQDGGRYANTDNSFVFLNNGNSALVEEGGKETYSDCTSRR